jgi:hypothetical protein
MAELRHEFDKSAIIIVCKLCKVFFIPPFRSEKTGIQIGSNFFTAQIDIKASSGFPWAEIHGIPWVYSPSPRF